MHQYLLDLPKPLHPHHPHQPISCNQTWIKGHQHRIRERPHLQGWQQELHSHRRVPRNQMHQHSNSTHRNLPQTDRRRDIVRQKIINFVFMYYSCKWHLITLFSRKIVFAGLGMSCSAFEYLHVLN